jgi:DNA-binding LacI/PurR family transcriptional regulator
LFIYEIQSHIKTNRELHVSVSTVSKALNDSPEISEQTKIKVQEYAKLKNYKPNVIGLNLKNRKTKTIGVIIPNILNPFFAKVFTGIEKVADEKGYNLITCISNESIAKKSTRSRCSATAPSTVSSSRFQKKRKNYRNSATLKTSSTRARPL